MSDRPPNDPFSAIDMEQFKQPSKQKAKVIEAELIREIAKQNNFESREAPISRPKHTAKTYSLFPEDMAVIKNGLHAYMLHTPSGQPSGSDIVRAALHHFSQLASIDQAQLIERYRARGKR